VPPPETPRRGYARRGQAPTVKDGGMAYLSPTGEMAALAKLAANWRGVVQNIAVNQNRQEEGGHCGRWPSDRHAWSHWGQRKRDVTDCRASFWADLVRGV
jgi:hypothetical protein